MSFETAIHQWREGERRLDDAPPPQRAALERVTDAIHRELRRRLGGAFTTDELADLYDSGTDWTLDLAVSRRARRAVGVGPADRRRRRLRPLRARGDRLRGRRGALAR